MLIGILGIYFLVIFEGVLPETQFRQQSTRMREATNIDMSIKRKYDC